MLRFKKYHTNYFFVVQQQTLHNTLPTGRHVYRFMHLSFSHSSLLGNICIMYIMRHFQFLLSSLSESRMTYVMPLLDTDTFSFWKGKSGETKSFVYLLLQLDDVRLKHHKPLRVRRTMGCRCTGERCCREQLHPTPGYCGPVNPQRMVQNLKPCRCTRTVLCTKIVEHPAFPVRFIHSARDFTANRTILIPGYFLVPYALALEDQANPRRL